MDVDLCHKARSSQLQTASANKQISFQNNEIINMFNLLLPLFLDSPYLTYTCVRFGQHIEIVSSSFSFVTTDQRDAKAALRNSPQQLFLTLECNPYCTVEIRLILPSEGDVALFKYHTGHCTTISSYVQNGTPQQVQE